MDTVIIALFMGPPQVWARMFNSRVVRNGILVDRSILPAHHPHRTRTQIFLFHVYFGIQITNTLLII